MKYIKFFPIELTRLAGLAGNDMRVILAIALLQHEKAEVVLNKAAREKICEDIGVSYVMLSQIITRLIKAGLIERVEWNTYKIIQK
jgi:DNA-binding MarR family transcriptional regulator